MSSQPITGPPPSFRASIAMDHSPIYSSSPTNINTGINHNRLSLQTPIGAIGNDALEPLRKYSAASPPDSIRSHLSNRNSAQYPQSPGLSPVRDCAAAEVKAQKSNPQEKPPSYSQSKFDASASNKNIYSTVMNTSNSSVPPQGTVV